MPDAAGVKRFQIGLPPLLSVIAGMVDVTGFITLGNVFTAHVTGNLVTGSNELVHRTVTNATQLLVIPVFIAALVSTWLIAKGSRKSGIPLARLLLAVQFLLLALVLTVSVTAHPSINPHGSLAILTVMIAVCAMASQYVLLRLTLPTSPSTAAMTGNLTNAVLLLLERTFEPPDQTGAEKRLWPSVYVLLGFLAGCIIAAGALPVLGDWIWSLPVVLAGIAVLSGFPGDA